MPIEYGWVPCAANGSQCTPDPSRSLVTQVVLISTYGRDEMQDLIATSAAVGFLPKSGLSGDAVRALLDGDQRDAR